MVHDVTTVPGSPHDLLGELAAAQWAVEDVVSVVDGGLAIDLARYLTARARLDAAVTAWNQRVGTGGRTPDLR